MFAIQNLFNSAVSTFRKTCEESPAIVAVTAVCALAAIAGTALYFHNQSQSNPDLGTIRQIASDIKKADVAIGDGDAYDFVRTHKKPIDRQKTIKGNLSRGAVFAKALSRKKSYHECPDLIVELGRRCLEDRSGVCDHMSAAVVTKVVQHIQKGGSWSSRIELVGNGRHSFAVVGREEGPIHCLKNWGKRTVTVDPWLGCLGVKPELTCQLREVNGVFLGSAVLDHARSFAEDDGSDLSVLSTLSVEMLHKLADDSSLKMPS